MGGLATLRVRVICHCFDAVDVIGVTMIAILLVIFVVLMWVTFRRR